MDEQQNEQAAAQPQVQRDPGALRRAMAKTTVENRFAKPIIPRRQVTFLVDASVCAPGIFDEDFELTISSLTSAMELEAAQRAKGEIASLAFHYARLSLLAVNGRQLDTANMEGDWLWEALGTAGRQLVAGMFAQFAMPDGDAQGKAVRTLRVAD